MPYLHCDKKYFSYKNLNFYNGKHKYLDKSDYLYQLATEVPVDKALIYNENGKIVNRPTDIPTEDDSELYIKTFVKCNGLSEAIDLRSSKSKIIKKIKEELNIEEEGEQDE